MRQTTSTRAMGWTIAVVTGLSVTCPAAMAQQEMTVEGEVVDPAAYLKDGRHGADQVDQTYEAVDGGQSLAILDDAAGALYLLLATEPGEDPNELVYDYVNQRVRATGHVYERGGVRGIAANSIEPVTPPAPPSP